MNDSFETIDIPKYDSTLVAYMGVNADAADVLELMNAAIRDEGRRRRWRRLPINILPI